MTEYEKKKQTFITRTIWTLVMIAGFFVAMLSGHIYIIGIVTAIQIISFKEVIAIANVPSRAKNLPFTRSLNWYFLGTTMYFLYGESVIYYFKHIVLVDKVLLPFATHHRFISFVLYVIGQSLFLQEENISDYWTGFVFFVASLQKGHYRFQFTQFAWTHMALYLIVVQAHFVMNNIFEGMIWFFLPAALVITNDIFAYICGITFGRTPLIQLSPKKTVEGFAGAWVLTIVLGYAITNVLMRYSYFLCPVNVRVTPLIQSSPTDLTGPRRQHFHRPKLHPKPRLPRPRLSTPLFPSSPPNHPFRTHAVPHPGLRNLCISDRAIRRLFRLGPQTDVQSQRLWGVDPRSRRHHGPYGLPVHHGAVFVHVLPELHRRVQSQCGRGHRNGHSRIDG